MKNAIKNASFLLCCILASLHSSFLCLPNSCTPLSFTHLDGCKDARIPSGREFASLPCILPFDPGEAGKTVYHKPRCGTFNEEI